MTTELTRRAVYGEFADRMHENLSVHHLCLFVGEFAARSRGTTCWDAIETRNSLVGMFLYVTSKSSYI